MKGNTEMMSINKCMEMELILNFMMKVNLFQILL